MPSLRPQESVCNCSRGWFQIRNHVTIPPSMSKESHYVTVFEVAWTPIVLISEMRNVGSTLLNNNRWGINNHSSIDLEFKTILIITWFCTSDWSHRQATEKGNNHLYQLPSLHRTAKEWAQLPWLTPGPCTQETSIMKIKCALGQEGMEGCEHLKYFFQIKRNSTQCYFILCIVWKDLIHGCSQSRNSQGLSQQRRKPWMLVMFTEPVQWQNSYQHQR